ncbi:MAG TPA: NAD(P)-dependent oxidoreductase [Aliidongia sp.]|nr:NAD(P)-dependent oxidoreductase [Aliidongia sp.]
MQKVLITGGAGFVGRRFCRHFLEAGAHVVCVDSLVPLTGARDPENGWPLFDPREFGSRFEFRREDCRSYYSTEFADDFDYAFHLAAIVGGREVIERQPLAVAEDLAIDAAYWRWAQKAQPGRSIMFSSSAAYPVSLQRKDGHVLLSEDMIDFDEPIGVPDLTYGWAKLTCEYVGRLAYEKHGMKSVVYRPFSGYGEDQDLTYPFPSIVKRVLNARGAREIPVWGSGDQMRDFIYIDDCVRGVIATMDKIEDGSAINLSTGLGTSFKQLTRAVAEQLGFSPAVNGLSDKPEGVFARVGDTSLQESLGFRADVDLMAGIAKAVAYFSEMQD